MHTRGLSYSLIFHSFLLLVLAVGIPRFLKKDRDLQPTAISVEVLPIAEISNVPKTPLPVKKQEPKPKPSPKKAPPRPKPVVRDQPKTTPEPTPQPKKEPAKKPEPTAKTEPKPTPKKPDTPDDPFEQLLKDLTEEQTSEATNTPKVPTQDSVKSKSERYDPTVPLSLSEKDAIRSQFAQHWRLPAGVKGDYTLSVEVRVLVNPDGTVQRAGIARHQAGRYQRDPIFRAAADSALRAVQLASPIKNLDPAKYDTWKDMVINFDPKEMLY